MTNCLVSSAAISALRSGRGAMPCPERAVAVEDGRLTLSPLLLAVEMACDCSCTAPESSTRPCRLLSRAHLMAAAMLMRRASACQQVPPVDRNSTGCRCCLCRNALHRQGADLLQFHCHNSAMHQTSKHSMQAPLLHCRHRQQMSTHGGLRPYRQISGSKEEKMI